MKFTDRNTAVRLLLKGDVDIRVITESIGFADAIFFLDNELIGMKPLFRQSIQYLCKPFFEAFKKAREKLHEALRREPTKKSGTFIFAVDDRVNQTVFYDLETIPTGGDDVGILGTIVVFVNGQAFPGPDLIFYTRMTSRDCVQFKPLFLVRDGCDFQGIIREVLCLIAFLKYCPVETKVVTTGNIAKHSRKEYHNKTKLPIEIVDSTWFTTIVRSEGFGVRGHFRLQPVGPGRSEVRLTWVSPYQKMGYTRKAKVLKGGPEERSL